MSADDAVFALVLGFPPMLVVMGVTSLVRHGTSSIGGALTIASAIALAVGLGAVGIIGSLDSDRVASLHALPVPASAVSLGVAAVPLLRGKGHSLAAMLAKAALAAIAVVVIVAIANWLFLACVCA